MNEKISTDPAKEAEIKSHYKDGFSIDGSPYTALGVNDYLPQSREDRKHHAQRVIAVGGDPECANWLLWSKLDEIGVARYPLGYKPKKEDL